MADSGGWAIYFAHALVVPYIGWLVKRGLGDSDEVVGGYLRGADPAAD